MNLLESLSNLKEFLFLRERPEFQRAKAGGQIGIPCLLREDELEFYDEERIRSALFIATGQLWYNIFIRRRVWK